MRIDVKKFLFVGLQEEKEAFFRNAQEAGIIEFIDPKGIGIGEMPQLVSILSSALKIIRGLPVDEQEDVDNLLLADDIARQVVDHGYKEEKLFEENRMLEQEIARVHIFGYYSLDDIAYIEKEGSCKVQFFAAKKGKAEEVVGEEGIFYIGSDHGLDYFVSIQKEPKEYPGMVEMKVDHSLKALESRLEHVRKRIGRLEDELKAYAKYYTLIHRRFVDTLNAFHLTSTQGNVRHVMDDKMYAVEGWVPVNRVNEELVQLVNKHSVHYVEIAIEEQDRVPTCLQNQGLPHLGEDLVHIYDTPSSTDKDPSLWVLAAFIIFFGIIIGDGGYGLIFLGLSFYLGYKFPKIGGAGRRALKLFRLLAFSCIAWGVLTNSFFGINIGLDNPLRKASLLHWMAEKKAAYHIAHHDDVYQAWVEKFPATAHLTDPAQVLKMASFELNGSTRHVLLEKFYDNFYMELALFIGTVHILLSMFRYLRRNWHTLGWILFLIGAYLYFPIYLNATSLIHFVFGVDKVAGGAAGFQLMVGGIGLAVLLAIVRQKFFGIFEIMVLIQIFADVLSYLRLYALGLSGSIVTATINDAIGSLAIVFGILLALIGHLINIVLSVMGGVIHGLRLNFIEWYHYSFEGGGKPFQPLKLMKIE